MIKDKDPIASPVNIRLEELNKLRQQAREQQEELRKLQTELLLILEENVLEMEKYFEKSAEGTVTDQELETLSVRVLLNKHMARYYKLASQQQQLIKEKTFLLGKASSGRE
ncbi:hypothetical protein [Cesiribacter sp. SM1]|uniref:hypothetical protein n=1 Tax=Cesiribacter sp. SM1 TaxID=2861196 RepID=UPI001CD7B1C2|nr:hypothetical protein [Cesiribacter sp. SM1]